MKHAGIAQKHVEWIKAELDRDDGHYKYEVDFHVNGVEYEYEINGLNGKILDWDKDYDD